MKRRKLDITQIPANVGKGVDERFQVSTPLRSLLNKVFPDHWSFLLGEIALYSFVVLVATGVFLALFFEPGLDPRIYHGPFVPLQGHEVTAA